MNNAIQLELLQEFASCPAGGSVSQAGADRLQGEDNASSHHLQPARSLMPLTAAAGRPIKAEVKRYI